MSLIFKALQRFGNLETEPGKDPFRSELPKRNAVPLRKVLVSPSVALGAATAIFVVGLIVSQGIRFIPTEVTSVAPVAIAAASGEGSTPGPTNNEVAGMVPGPDGNHFDPRQIDPTEQVSFQVYPPEFEKRTLFKAAAGPDKVQFHYQESTGSKTEDGGGGAQSEMTAPAQTAALDTNNSVVDPSMNSSEQSAPLSSGNANRPRELSVIRYDTTSPAAGPSDSGTGKPVTNIRSETSISMDTNPAHQRQSEQATLHLEVSRLAQRISSAIQSDDHQQAAILLAKLVNIKGADNDFVLKLRAYSLIRQGLLDDARTILTEVLAHDAMDREAGLNMAVIDMKTGRLDVARRRLVQLQELYPEDRHIATYLRQLPH